MNYPTTRKPRVEMVRVPCAFCGIELVRYPYTLRRSKSGHAFCNTACSAAFVASRPKAACVVDSCDRDAFCRGRCNKHYQQWRSSQPEIAERERTYRRNYHRRYYEENREAILKKTREHQKSPEYRAKKAAAAKKWAEEHPERAQANRRRSWIKRKYGLTVEEYEVIIARGCAICGAQEGDVPFGRKKLLCLDHDHANGKVRDALCHYCNVALGSMQDDPTRLRAAADYLEKHR